MKAEEALKAAKAVLHELGTYQYDKIIELIKTRSEAGDLYLSIDELLQLEAEDKLREDGFTIYVRPIGKFSQHHVTEISWI